MQTIPPENYPEKLQLIKKQQLKNVLQDVPLEDGPLRVVEMGVGEGNLSLTLKEFYPNLNITVVDKNIDPFKNTLRQEQISSIKMLEEEITRTSIPSTSIDWVFYYNLMHHLSSKEIISSLEETSRILKDQANLVIIDVAPQPKNKAQRILSKIYEIEAEIDLKISKTCERIYSPSEIINFLYKAGFVITEEKVYYHSAISLPHLAWHEMKRHIEKSYKKLNKKECHNYTKKLESIQREVKSHGLETLPLFMILARKSRIRRQIEEKMELDF